MFRNIIILQFHVYIITVIYVILHYQELLIVEILADFSKLFVQFDLRLFLNLLDLHSENNFLFN